MKIHIEMEIDTETHSKMRKPKPILQSFYKEEHNYEIGIDEAGRGPMFGRLYVATVILPKDDSFQHKNMIDSKKIKSKKKMEELSNYIKEHAIAWDIQHIEANIIDTINIRQAVLTAMHECVRQIIYKTKYSYSTGFLLIDGNDFIPFMYYDEQTQTMIEMAHITIEGGDNTYSAIAAASILAKNARDNYILDLCKDYPILEERYNLHKNMGYGTKAHLDGIKQYGITQWHRKSFGLCKISHLASI